MPLPRRGMRSAAVVACIVLAMLMAQLVLASGHVHLEASHHSAQPQIEVAHWPVFPAPNDHPHHDESQCEVCWAQAAAGSALIPPAALLRQMGGFGDLRPCPVVLARIAPFAASAFQPRAPPASASDGAADLFCA